MRVLITVDRLDIGGVEAHVATQARFLKRLGHEVCVASAGGILVPLLEEDEIPHFELLFSLKGVNEIAEKMAEIIRKYDIQIVHAHAFYNLPAVYAACETTGIPYVLTYHGIHTVDQIAAQFGLYYAWWLWTYGLRGATATIAVSDEVKAHLGSEFNLSLEGIRVIPNPVERQTQPIPLCRPDASRPLQIAIISRIDYDKLPSIRVGLELAEALHSRWPAGARVRVIGTGSAIDELRSTIALINVRNGIDLVVEEGATNRISERVKSCDLIIGMGRVVVEAAASAKPVVLAGYAQSLDLVTPQNWSELKRVNFSGRNRARSTVAECAEQVYRLLRDEHAWKETVEALWAASAEFDALQICSQLVEVYRDALAGERSQVSLAHSPNPSGAVSSLLDKNLADDLLEKLLRELESRFQGPGLSRAIGILLAERNRPHEALAHLRSTLEKYPNDKGVLFYIVHCLLALGRSSEARPYAEKLLTLEKTDPVIWYTAARVEYETGNVELAISLCKEAINRDPAYFDAHYYLGYLLERSGKLLEACTWYQRALALRPGDRGTLLRLSQLEAQLGNTINHGEDTGELKELCQEVLDLTRQLVEKERSVGELSAKLAARELELQQVQDSLKQMQSVLEQLQHEVDALREEKQLREALEGQLSYYQAEVRRLVEALEWNRQALERIQNSRAWKVALLIGAPYGQLKRLLGRVRRFAVLAAIAVGKRMLPTRVRLAVYPAYIRWRKRLLPEENDKRPTRVATQVTRVPVAHQVAPLVPTQAMTSARDQSAGETLMWSHLRPYFLHRYRPKVSVIIPVYNHADLLPTCLDSVLNQTYDNLEVIVLNDGSTDNVEEVLSRYAENPRVKIFTQQNQGLPRALTNAFRQATGEFYLWTSADNISLPRQVEALLTHLMLHPDVDMVYSNYNIIDDNGKPLLNSDFRVHNQVAPNSPTIVLPRTVETLGLIEDNFIGASFMYTASAGRILGEYDPALLGTEDYDYWLRMEKLFRIERLDSSEPLYAYRVHANSLSEKFGHSQIRHNVPKLLSYHREREAYYDRPFDVLFISGNQPAAAPARALMARWALEYYRQGCNVIWATLTDKPDQADLPVAFPEEVRILAGDYETILSGVAQSALRSKRLIIADQPAVLEASLVEQLRQDGVDTFVVSLVPSPEGFAETSVVDFLLPMTSETARAVAQRFHPEAWLRVGPGMPSRDLLMKARDNRYYLWDVPSNDRPKLGYFGPLRKDLIDTDYLRSLIMDMPDVDFILIGVEGESNYDFRRELQDLANVHHLGMKPASEMYRYLSGFDCMILPLRNTEAGRREAERLAMEWVLLAGRKVAASVMPEEVRLPYLVITGDVDEAVQEIRNLLATPVDLEIVDRYLSVHTWEHQARRLLKLANNRLFYARTRGVEKREKGLVEVPPVRFGSSRTRVLIEVTSLDKGGLEQVIYNTVVTMNKEQFEPIVVCVERDGYVADRCREVGVPVHVLGADKEREYVELLSQYQVDVVVEHYSTFGARIAYQKGIPVLSVLHNSYVWMEDDQIEELRRADRWISQYIAVSDDVKAYTVHRVGVPPAKVIVIPNGIPIAQMEEKATRPPRYTRKDFGLTDSDYVFLNLASVDGRKGQNSIVSAMRAVVRRHPEVKVLIAGNVLDRGYYEELRKRIARWNLDNHILFTGFIAETEDLFRLSDAFLLPSIVEGWSIAKTEAMYFGLPLLLTDVGGARHVIRDNDIGILISPSHPGTLHLTPVNLYHYVWEEGPKNTGDLVKAMLEMVENREYWRKAALAGREKVLRNYTMEQVVRRYEQIISALVRYAGAELASL